MSVDEDMALLLLFSMFVLHDLLFGGSGDNISLVLSHQTIWLNRTFFLGVSIPVSDIIVFVVGLSLSFPLNCEVTTLVQIHTFGIRKGDHVNRN